MVLIIVMLLLAACGGGGTGPDTENLGAKDVYSPLNFVAGGVSYSAEGAYNLHAFDVDVDPASTEIKLLFRVVDRVSRSRVDGVILDNLIVSENDQLINLSNTQAQLSKVMPKLNYIFMIDVSLAVTEATLEAVKASLLAYLDDALLNGATISIITYSDTVTQLLKATDNAVRLREVIEGIELQGDTRALELALQVGMNTSEAQYGPTGIGQDALVLITSGLNTTATGVIQADLNEAYVNADVTIINTSHQALPINITQYAHEVLMISSQEKITQSFRSFNTKMQGAITDLYELTYHSEQRTGRHTLKVELADAFTCNQVVGNEETLTVFTTVVRNCIEVKRHTFSANKFTQTEPKIVITGRVFGKDKVTLTASSDGVENPAVYTWSKRDLIGTTEPLLLTTGSLFEIEIDRSASQISNSEIVVTDTVNGISKRFNVALGTGWANYHQIDAHNDRICTIRDNKVTADLEINCKDQALYTTGIHGQSVQNPTQVKVGGAVDCAIHDGGVKCWRQTSDYNGTTPIYADDLVNHVPELQNPTELVVDKFTACALDDTGVHCWGRKYTEVDSAPYNVIPELIAPSNLTMFFDESSHIDPVVCVKDENLLKCWDVDGVTTLPWQGGKYFDGAAMGCYVVAGQLSCSDDDGRTTNISNYSYVTGIPENLGYVDEIFIPKNRKNGVCALADGQVTCWASTVNEGPTASLVNTPPLINPRGVATSSRRACAISDQGLVCWGNWRGSKVQAETTVTVLHNPDSMALSTDMCVEDDSGPDCWGNLIDLPDVENPSFYTSKHTAGGRNHYCAVNNGKVVCMGDSNGGATALPQDALQGLVKTTNLIAGDEFTCALVDGEPVCVAGREKADSTRNPSEALLEDEPEINNFIKWAAGEEHVCALDEDGVKCWGNDDYGQVSGPTGLEAKDIGTIDNQTCVITSLDKLECFGISIR
ncbi:MAG: VWA domain-containing protein [Cycloclasticus sp.]